MTTQDRLGDETQRVSPVKGNERASLPLILWLEQQPVDDRLPVILQIFRQLVYRLSLIHAQCRTHGSLTPSSIAVVPSSLEIILADSRELDLSSLGSAGSMRDACYLAPEQTGVLAGTTQAATDLYSCGLILYRMLAGYNPLDSSSLNDLLMRQATWVASSLRLNGIAIPRALDELLLRLLKRSAIDRYQKASAVLQDIDAIVRSLDSMCHDTEIAIGTGDTRERFAEPSFVGRSSWIANFVRRAVTDPRISLSPWIIHGAKGEGKTRLLHEFASEAVSRGKIVLRVTGSETDHSRPLESMLSLMKSLEASCRSHESLAAYLRCELTPFADSLHELTPWLWDSCDVQSHRIGPDSFAGRRLKDALSQFFKVLGQYQERIFLLIDDLDRCDEMSHGIIVDWIHAQQKNISGRLTFVATTSETAHSLAVNTKGILIESLGSLHVSDVTQMLMSMGGDFPSEAIALIANASHGNPSMAVSLLYGMLESGTAHRTADGWQIRTLSMESLQGHRTDVRQIAERLKSLSGDCIRLLSAAAILGRSCDFDEARRLARLNETDAQSGLEMAIQRQLIWMDATRHSLGFVHEQVRQGFLEQILPRDRVAYHLRAARMIRRSHVDRCFELALHFDAAGRGNLAAKFSLQAAKQSQLQYATDLAIRYYSIALKWIPFGETSRHVSVKEELAEVYSSTGEYDLAEKTLRDALENASERLAMTRLTGKLGDVEFKRGQMQKAADYYAQAIALSGAFIPKNFAGMLFALSWQVILQLGHTLFGRPKRRPRAEPMRRLRWHLLSRMGHTFWFSRGALWTLLAHLLTMNEAECYEDTPELAKTYSEHAPVCSLLRLFRRANAYSQQSLAIRTRMHDTWGQGQTLSYASVVSLAEARFEECVRVSMDAVSLLQRTGDAWETNMARYQGANALYRLGRFREAAEHAQQIHRSGVEIGDSQATGISLDVLMRTSPSTLSPSVVEQTAAMHRTDAQSHAQTQLALAILRLRQSRYREAVDGLIEAIHRCRRAGHLNTYISPCYAWLATASRQQLLATPLQNVATIREHRKSLHRAVHQAYRISKRYRADLPHALRELGWLEALSGRFRIARRRFLESLRIARQIESPMEEFETLRTMLDFQERLGANHFPLSEALHTRFLDLQSQFADSISLIHAVKTGQLSLSLVDRFGKLLEDGRRIAGSLNKSAINNEGCLAAQHLLRGQRVILFERAPSEIHWIVSHCLASTSEAIRDPKPDDYQAYILETTEAGVAKYFATSDDNGLSRGSLLGVPIRIRETIVGCLMVEHTQIEQFFGETELQVAEFIATLTGAALENAEGFATLRDLNANLEQRVTSRTEELREAMAVAVAASQAKSQFLATMSHEVRTPLNGILGMTRLALAKTRDSQQTHYLSSIQRSGESLLQLLNDLLDFSKLEAGKMTIESIPFDPRQMLDDVLSLMAAPAWQKGIEVIASFDPCLPEQISGDGVRLRQIVANLVGNAIKFTSTGYVEVRAEIVASESAASKRWRISVIDTGIGIPADKQASIFEAFSQADGTTTRRFGGTGLGLSISAELVKLMNGMIEVESEVGQGSRFSVVLPLEECVQPTTPPLHSCRLLSLKVLVLEPHSVARKSLEKTLEAWGATVVAIENWSNLDEGDAIDLALFDLAILSGPEAASLAQRARQCSLITWVAQSPDEAPLPGVINVRKPVVPAELVRQFVSLAPVASPVTFAESTAGLSGNPIENRSAPQLRVLVAEDGEINRMVLVGLLELLGHTAWIAENGVQATQLAESQSFDICLMDLDMPEMDGIEATKVVRGRGNPLPIYAMTAHHDEHHANLCLEAGMNGYLTKPIEADQLKQILQSVVAVKLT